ncbi:MAG: quinone-dependent dihydroorotate dehydrogenase [Verrucomicrobiales bacterium]
MLHSLYAPARAALFQLDAEKAHHLSLAGLRMMEKTHLLEKLSPALPAKPVTLAGLRFPNPVGLAAGLDKEANCVDALGRLGFGFIEVGTLTPVGQPGNDKPRLFRLKEHQAIINRMGFNNPGIEQGIENLKSARHYQGIVGINIGKNKVTPNERALDDYLIAFEKAYPHADYITANFSSPNTPGLRDLQSAEAAAQLLGGLKEKQAELEARHGKKVPLALKVAPDLDPEQIKSLSRVFREGGLDLLIATNTTISREAVANHPLARESGGLSGAILQQASTEVIAAFHAELGEKVPLIGVGGIFSAEDALAKRAAGAKLVQLYTGFIYEGPKLIHEIVNKW